MKWWRWMYKENPAGHGRIWLAEHDGKIVGHSAIIPTVMKIGTEVATGFQSIGTMTHPGYRRQGIYETLAKKVYAEAAAEGMYVGYRFPNKNSYPIAIRKLNWFDVAKMQGVRKPLNWRNTLKSQISNRLLLSLGSIGGNLTDKIFYRPGKIPVVKGLTISQVSSFDERVNEFWDTVSDQYQIMVVRNKDYLNWRYVAIPGVNYQIYLAEKMGQICGYLVLRCVEQEQVKRSVIFDALAQSVETAEYLVSKVLERCRQEEVDIVSCSMIASKAYLKVFRKNGFIYVPFVKGMRFCAYSSSSCVSKEFLKNPENWFVQRGDSDII